MDDFKVKDVEVKLEGADRLGWIVFGCLTTYICAGLTLGAIKVVYGGIKGSYIEKDQKCRFLD